MESKELAEFDQENEEWGESCVGSLTLKSNSPIISNDIVTKEGYYIENFCNTVFNEERKERFINKFFPNGLPRFTVVKLSQKCNGYVYNDIFVDNRKVYTIFKNVHESGKHLEEALNINSL